MITLKTLPTASGQEVFDQVSKHLLQQARKSKKKLPAEPDGTPARDICAYRGDAGLQCAAGCLMSDEDYTPSFEALSWATLAERQLVPEEHASLIQHLQAIHDNQAVTNWLTDLTQLAYKFCLRPPIHTNE